MIKAQCIGFSKTPPLWKKKRFDIQQFEFPNIDLNSFHPKPLSQKLRLGHQMEYVFKQLVEFSEKYEVILHNLPVRDEEKTLGEIDFILKDKTRNQLIHVELTYKFYVINPETSEPNQRIIGPNKRDSLFEKTEKIRNKQFSLLHSPEGVKVLKDNNINHSELEHQCCFKAQLFQPFGSTSVDIDGLNEDCLAGQWLRFADFNKPAFADAQFYLPTKSEWVIAPNNEVVWKSHSEILIEIGERLSDEYAPLLWWKKSEVEFEKIFVVWW